MYRMTLAAQSVIAIDSLETENCVICFLTPLQRRGARAGISRRGARAGISRGEVHRKEKYTTRGEGAVYRMTLAAQSVIAIGGFLKPKVI